MLNAYSGVTVMNKSPGIIHNKLAKATHTNIGINCIIHCYEIVLVYYVFLCELKHKIKRVYMLTFIDIHIYESKSISKKSNNNQQEKHQKNKKNKHKI